MIYPIEELDPVDAAKFRRDVAECWSAINRHVNVDAAARLSLRIFQLIAGTEPQDTVVLALTMVLLTIAEDCPASPAVLMGAISMAVVRANEDGLLGETLQ